MSVIEKYKGFDLSFNTYAEKFVAKNQDGMEITRSASFSGLKANVDAYAKRKMKLKPFDVIWRGRDKVVRLVSIADEKFAEIWVSWKNERDPKRSRSKESLNQRRYGYGDGKAKPHFSHVTEENLKIIEQIHKLDEQRTQIDQDIKDLRTTYTKPITEEYLKMLLEAK